MRYFLEWLAALVVGIILAVIGLVIAAFIASYCSIWLAGIALLLLFFGAISGLYFLAERGVTK